MQAGDSDSDGIQMPSGAAVNLEGGTIRAVSDGYDAELDFTSATAVLTGHKVDGSQAPLTGGVCDRTQGLHALFIGAANRVPHSANDGIDTVENCSQVELEHLRGITNALFRRFSIPEGVTSLKRGAFAGVENLKNLVLVNNGALAHVSAGAFEGMTALEKLNLSDVQIVSIEAGTFEGLGALEVLNLSGNRIASIGAGAFEGVPALTVLDLSGNRISSIAAGAFDGLPVLEQLELHENALAAGSLPDGLFEKLTRMITLYLNENPGSATFKPTGADAGPGGRLSAGQPVTLGGGAPDGGPWGTNLVYSWTQTDGDDVAATTVTLDDADTLRASITAPVLDEEATVRLRLRVEGRGGASHGVTSEPAEFTIGPLKVTGVAFASAPASGDTYGAGENIEVAVTFSDTVVITGMPSISPRVGSAFKVARYVRGSESRRLVFAYEVQAADMDADGISMDADQLSVEFGTITSRFGAKVPSFGAAFQIEHDALAADPNHKVDGSATALTGGICGRTNAGARRAAGAGAGERQRCQPTARR